MGVGVEGNSHFSFAFKIIPHFSRVNWVEETTDTIHHAILIFLIDRLPLDSFGAVLRHMQIGEEDVGGGNGFIALNAFLGLGVGLESFGKSKAVFSRCASSMKVHKKKN